MLALDSLPRFARKLNVRGAGEKRKEKEKKTRPLGAPLRALVVLWTTDDGI